MAILSLFAMMGDGRGIDLYKLFKLVKGEGGYDVVCDKKMWDVVAMQLGFADSSIASSVKLVYTKYLLTLDSWLNKVGASADATNQSEVVGEYGLVDSREKFKKKMMELHNGLIAGMYEYLVTNEQKNEDMIEYCMVSESVSERYSKGYNDDHTLYVFEGYGQDQDNDAVSDRKRKTTDDDQSFAGTSFQSRTQQQHSLQSEKLHPSLYDESPEATNKIKSGMDKAPSPIAKKQPIRSSNSLPSGHIRIGPHFQAVLPHYTGKPSSKSSDDSKWIGTQLWPSENAPTSKFLIEREPIGKGRQEDSCGCMVPNSYECVKFHIYEKRDKLKLELGPIIFNEFGFDKVGEEQVRRLWTDDEENRFKDVVQAIISSSSSWSSSSRQPNDDDKFIWDDIFRSFPERSREDLVRYYYNVFLYQRRGYQNRHTPDAISSDDEESYVRNSFGRVTTQKKAQNQRQSKSRKSTSGTPKKVQSKGI